MKLSVVLCVSLFACSVPCLAGTVNDVPASHWAKAEVQEIVSHNIMSAPNGKFSGATLVTRRELAISLAKLAQSLEKGEWKSLAAAPVKQQPDKSGTDKPVTRYQLAFVLDRIAHFAAAGLPRSTGKAYFQSVQLPPIPKVTVPRTDPAFASISYLAGNKMAPGTSILLKPGDQPVTGKELADCITSMIAGLNDKLTDEPQNRPEIAPPDRHDHGKK